MSLSEDITSLVTEARNLVNAFNDKEDDIDLAIQTAIETIPDLVLNLYLDQDNGDDENDGLSSANPVQTIGRAIELVGEGRSAQINLLSDLTFTTRREYLPVNMQLFIVGSGDIRTINLGLQSVNSTTDGWDYEVGGFYCRSYGLSTVGFTNVKIVFPSAPAEGTVGDARYSALIGSNSMAGPSFVACELTSSEIEYPEDGVGCVLGADARGVSLSVKNTTYDADLLAGNWVASVSAGVAPSDVNWVLSNMTSL